MESRDLNLTYCAGLFDGEGSFVSGPQGQVHENGKYRGRWYCHLSLCQVNPDAVKFLQKTVGAGKIYYRADGLCLFNAANSAAAHVAKLLVPFLIQKKQEGKLFLEYARLFAAKAGQPKATHEILRRRWDVHCLIAKEKARNSISKRNGVNSVKLPEWLQAIFGDNTEPSASKVMSVDATVYRLEGEEPTNTPSTSAPPERDEIVGTAA